MLIPKLTYLSTHDTNLIIKLITEKKERSTLFGFKSIIICNAIIKYTLSI